MQHKLPLQMITFYIRLHNGNGCSLTLPANTAVSQLVSQLSKQQLQLPDSYRFVFKGKHVKNYDLTLTDVGIIQNCILHIEAANSRSLRELKIDISIFHKGEKLVVKLGSGQKITALKQSIYKLTKIALKDQLLVFKGRKLNNDRTLEHYRIGSDSLICLHSTSKSDDRDDVQSDYQSVNNGRFLKDNSMLLESVLSLAEKKSEVSKTTLFRSESIDKKHLQEWSPYEVQIHQKKGDDSSYGDKSFNFQLFKSVSQGNIKNNPMKVSMTFNLFDSLRSPVNCPQVYSQQQDSDSSFDQNLGKKMQYPDRAIGSPMAQSFIHLEQK